MAKYTVIELQDGIINGNEWAFDDRNEAEAKWHSVLAVAATSQVALHTCVILTDEGFLLESEKYEH